MARAPITIDPDGDPWERQTGESVKQHTRFLTFRNIRDGGHVRTLRYCVEVLTKKGDPIAYRTLQQISWENRWPERVHAWDTEQDRDEREQLFLDRRNMIKRHRQVAGALLTKAIKALALIDEGDLDAADVVRIVKLATDVERTALSLPKETVALVGADGGPVQTEDLTGLTGEERRLRLGEIAMELSRRAGVTTDDDE